MSTTTTMSPIRAVIADDEMLARKYLRELLGAHPEVDIVGECANGIDAVETIQRVAPDLVFLDIQMPKLDGFEVLEALGQEAPRIIFVTAYDEFAIRAFEVHAVDYLLKPFSEERLADALSRMRSGQADGLDGKAVAKTARGNQPLSRIVVKDGPNLALVPVSEVDYIAAEEDYIAIHSGGRARLKLQTISSMEDTLDPLKFVRIHRSIIANIDRIVRIESPSKDAKTAILRDGTRLPVSRSGYKRLRDAMEGVLKAQ
jgi:two-component system, LytTR family, response regulator